MQKKHSTKNVKSRIDALIKKERAKCEAELRVQDEQTLKQVSERLEKEIEKMEKQLEEDIKEKIEDEYSEQFITMLFQEVLRRTSTSELKKYCAIFTGSQLPSLPTLTH